MKNRFVRLLRMGLPGLVLAALAGCAAPVGPEETSAPETQVYTVGGVELALPEAEGRFTVVPHPEEGAWRGENLLGVYETESYERGLEEDGRLWGSLFFLFMAFAALSTVLAVFENIICSGMELTGWNRQKSSDLKVYLIIALSLPCVLGYNVWAWDGFAIFGGAVLDVEDFLVSNLFLPLGSLVYLLFCVTRYGWGWDNYKKEVNTGEGLKMHDWMRGYLTYGLPLIVLFIFVFGLYDKFIA